MLMTHLVAGYPDPKTSLKLALTLIKAGADILEVQIPFSDPVADGPAIVAACHTALKSGSGYQMALNLCQTISKQTSKTLVIMTYANIPFQIGFDRFCKAVKKADVSGLIVPDLPFDSQEGRELQLVCSKNGLNLIQVISPGIKKERLLEVIECATGFIYCTTSKGTTGRKISASKELFALLRTLKKHTKLPVAVGFGFSSGKDIQPLKNEAEIFVVGSAFIKLYEANKAKSYKKMMELVNDIKDTLN